MRRPVLTLLHGGKHLHQEGARDMRRLRVGKLSSKAYEVLYNRPNLIVSDGRTDDPAKSVTKVLETFKQNGIWCIRVPRSVIDHDSLVLSIVKSASVAGGEA